ncbi:MAG: O-antigen ligase family protein, partial [Flammeovirgaceae bacterium]
MFFFDNFTSAINSHPTYLAYNLIVAITLVLYNMYRSEFKARDAFLTVFLTVVLMLTGGQTAFVSLLLVTSFFALKFLLEYEDRYRKIFFLILTIVSIIFVDGVINPYSKEATLNDSWDRLILWKSAVSANYNPLTGVGTGDYKIELNKYYDSHGLEQFAKDNLNSHNQFIQTYFSNGVLGLIAIVLLIARPLYFAVMFSQPVGIIIFFPFIIYGMTEVFLGRYQGVVL